ncbi:MAG TPA: double-strand break repair protein AddB [Methylocystis sp.]|nr:double-strand break repair protein AddB [Methylocystis sp.]
MTAHVFSIPPGVAFLSTFVDALLSGALLPGVSRESAPLDLARLTIYVPTQRAGRALAFEFARGLDKPSALLPRIRPLGALDDQDEALLALDESDPLDPSLAPAIEEIERRLMLAQPTLHWARSLKHAIVSVDASGAPTFDTRESFLVSPSAAIACALAKELAALVDEFIIEGVDPAAIGGLVDEGFDQYWAITRQFLQIALHQWPSMLKERGLVDGAARRKALIEAQIRNLKGPGAAAPVIALGSTGSNPTTARLLGAIARLPQGAVVLPGLDLSLDARGWEHIGDAVGEHCEPAFTHPQSMLKRLLRIMKIERDEVRELGAPAPAQSARRRLVSEALRPADSADGWRAFRESEGAGFDAALAGVAYVEAPDERLEALTLALYLREALETAGRTAALVTPDRQIARRVASELGRFAIEIDDSGGEPLGATPLGALARELSAIAANGATAVALAALFAHPLVAFGLTRETVARLAPVVEIALLRAAPGEGDGWAARVPEAVARANEKHAQPLLKRLAEENWRREVEDLLGRLDQSLAPLLAEPGEIPLARRVASLRESLEAVTAGADSAANGVGAEELLALLDALATAQVELDFDAAGFASFLDQLLFETIVHGPRRAHPRLKILGPLEARLIDADLLLLAGLDESVWPPQAEAGAFLNRGMRAKLGLTPPERRIGQSAHDFEMALGARDVVLSRAIKRDGAPTVASRFVTRLRALAGDAFSACKKRGDAMLATAGALDRPEVFKSCARPEPRPRLELRPTQLSVTRIETLRRDPYSIYAERILRLDPLDPLGGELGAREMGTAIHAAIEDFIRAHPYGPPPEDAGARLVERARRELSAFLRDPEFRAFKWPRVVAGLDHALLFEKARRALNMQIFVEEAGDWEIKLADGSIFRLTARADRIEVDEAGAAHIFDYKTGKPPSNPQVLVGFAPQLTLQAAMIAAGAFKEVGRYKTADAGYLSIGDATEGDGEPVWIKPKKDTTFGELVAEHAGRLVELLNQFREENRSYPSRPFVELKSRVGDYDHLARFKEWSRDAGAAET